MVIDTSEVHALAAEMRAYVDRVPATAERVVAKVAHDIVGSAQRNIIANDTVDTGNLLNSVSATVDGLEAEIGPTAEYGDFIEEGTGLWGPSHSPYEIPNAFGLGITVEHPGIQPQPYMGPAFDEHEPRLESALGQLGERILR